MLPITTTLYWHMLCSRRSPEAGGRHPTEKSRSPVPQAAAERITLRPALPWAAPPASSAEPRPRPASRPAAQPLLRCGSAPPGAQVGARKPRGRGGGRAMAGAGRPGLSPPLLFLLVLPMPPAAAALRLLLGAAPPFTCSQPVSAGEGSWGAAGLLGPVPRGRVPPLRARDRASPVPGTAASRSRPAWRDGDGSMGKRLLGCSCIPLLRGGAAMNGSVSGSLLVAQSVFCFLGSSVCSQLS